jgi:hypothetical protein
MLPNEATGQLHVNTVPLDPRGDAAGKRQMASSWWDFHEPH